jgi:capsular polysaccharide biosynthesis protein
MKEKIYIKDFKRILNTHKSALLKIMGISILSFIVLSFILPKTYKSEFELNINPKYFKNALTADVIPEINSSTEMVQT